MKIISLHNSRLLGLCLLLFLVLGCSTEKKGFMNRLYHSTTTRFNGYFNGNESLRKGVEVLAEGHQDNYDEVLDIYRLGNESASAVNPYADKAIKKAGKVIDRHSMLIKGDQYNTWIDDSYLLMGKAHYYKREYYPAKEMFEYVSKQFKDDPIHYAGLIWLLRAHTATESYDKAQRIIDLIENDNKFSNDYLGEYTLAKANMHIQRKEYGKAIPELTTAIANTRDKRKRTRYTYILAQLYQHTGDNAKASFYYDRVLKKNPSYEMAFNAKINKALLFDASQASSASLKKELQKMAKDEKNLEYLDRIYYALAEIELSEGNRDEAIELLKKSAQKSVANQKQKGLSFLKLADLHFEDREYELAEAYYDSTVSTLPQEHEEFTRAENKKSSLSDLVKNLKIVAFQDSVQQLARMDSLDLDLYIEDLIAKIKEKEEQEQLAQQTQQLQQNQQQQSQNQGGSGSQWYFYNQTALSFGFQEFRRIWGNRKLEDNWRRKNKQSTAQFSQEEETAEDTLAQEDRVINKKSKAFYYQDIPLTKAEMDSSHARIQDALYSLGVIYKDQLLDFQASIEAFEELLERYPNGKYTLTAYYQLFRLHKEHGDPSQANVYKQKILQQFPESEYAQIISDPNYLEKLEARKGEAEAFYGKVYDAYLNRDYYRVIDLANEGLKKYPNSEIEPRFEYLKTMAKGKMSRLPEFQASLKDFVARYPEAKIKEEAQKVLDYINEVMGETPEQKPQSNQQEEKPEKEEKPEPQLYTYNQDTAHYYMTILNAEAVNLNDFKAKLSDFNGEFYSLAELNIQNLILEKGKHMVYVNKFENATKAKDYYNAVNASGNIFDGLEKQADYQHFVIGVNNFPILYKDKDVGKYMEFFLENYKKQGG